MKITCPAQTEIPTQSRSQHSSFVHTPRDTFPILINVTEQVECEVPTQERRHHT